MGAEDVVSNLLSAGFNVARNGSRGMAWAEPLLEIQENGKRIAFACISPEMTADASPISKLAWDSNHPSYVGQLEEVPFFANQTRLVFDRIGNSEVLEVPEFEVLKSALSFTSAEIISQIEKSGLRGRGGAGFPAHIKWRTVLETPSDQKYIVCNADEGDSGTFADRILMEGDPYRLNRRHDYFWVRYRRKPRIRLLAVRVPNCH